MNSQSYKSSYFWLLFGALALLLLIRLGATPIYILDEAKNAQCAREMLQRGDWIVPTFNHELRTDKPPLHYFFMMMAYKIFGVNEFAARFFSVVMGLLTVLVTYLFTKKYINDFAAFCSALILAASTHFLFEFRLSVPDPYLIFFITLGLFSAFAWLQQNKSLYLFIAATSLALATLAKGPVALALPGLCVLIWVILKKKWRVLFTWKLIPAFLLLCLIILPWYIAVHIQTNGEWTRGFFIENNLNRFSDPQEGHGGFFLLTLLFVLIGLLPFSGFWGEVIKKRTMVFNKDLVQFSAIVVLVFIIFFSIASTKLPNYAMPCYPFAAIILGNYISALMDGMIASKKYPVYILIAITFLIPVAGYFAIQQEVEAQQISWITLLLLFAPVGLLLVLRSANWSKRIISLCIIYSLFNAVGLWIVYPKLYSQNPVAKTLNIVKQEPYLYSYIAFNPGYNFYLNTNIPKYYSLDSIKAKLQQHPDALVISRKEFVDSLQTLNLQVIASHHDIFELPTTVILKYNAKP